jgi:hypothetical protein
VATKPLPKSANTEGKSPLPASMSDENAASITAGFAQLKTAHKDLSQGQQVELINARRGGKKDEVFSSLAGVAMMKDAEALKGAMSALQEGLLTMKPSEDTIVKVFTADNFGREYSPMMVAAMTENPEAIVQFSGLLEQLKANGLISDAGLAQIYSKRDAQGDSVMDNAMLGGNEKVIDAVLEGMGRTGMPSQTIEGVLGFATNGEGAPGDVMNPLAKNIINKKNPQAIEAYANGLKKLENAGAVTYEVVNAQFNKAISRAMLTDNVDALNTLGDVMRSTLTPRDALYQLGAGGPASPGCKTLVHCLGPHENTQLDARSEALCDQLIQTDAKKAIWIFRFVGKKVVGNPGAISEEIESHPAFKDSAINLTVS